MKESIPKTNPTNAAIVLRIPRHQEARLYMKGLIPKRNPSNATIAVRVSQHQVTGRYMKGSIPRFSKSSDRTKHERVHTKEKPYQCSHCTKGPIVI